MKIRNLSLAVLAFLLLGMFSCKKETVDVTDLLKSIPSSAAGVVVFNVEGLLSDAGCKIKDHELTPGKELMGILQGTSNKQEKEFMMLFDGSTGIEPKGAAVFYDSSRSFLTFALYDVNKFCNFIEKRNGTKFTDEGNGVKLNGKIAVKGAQAWVLLSSDKRIDPDGIAAYASLGVSQSFLTTEIGEKLLVEENDIRGWAIINTFVNEFVSRSNRSMVTLGMGFLFEDPESVKFKADFKKGELEAECVILNSKGKPAKYLLPSEKIDVAAVKTLGSTCDAMMAFTVNSKLIKKFEQLGASFGGALFGDLGEMFKNVDGTIGLVTGGEGIGESVNGFVTTKGDASQTLKDLVSKQIAPISQDGKLLRFSKGDVKGNLSIDECAEELKGCCLGFAADATGFNSLGYGENTPKGFKNIFVKFNPESGGLEVEVEVQTNDSEENALLTLLKSY